MHFCSFHFEITPFCTNYKHRQQRKKRCQPKKSDITQNLLSQIFDVIQSDVTLYSQVQQNGNF